MKYFYLAVCVISLVGSIYLKIDGDATGSSFAFIEAANGASAEFGKTGTDSDEQAFEQILKRSIDPPDGFSSDAELEALSAVRSGIRLTGK